MCENDGPMLPKIVQPPSFSLGTLSLQKVRRIFRGSVLTPSPENTALCTTGSSTTATYSDDSDSSESLKYSLPPTPNISDDCSAPKITPLLPTVKAVMSVEMSALPDTLRLQPCQWLECCVQCDSREMLHEHILDNHSSREMLCEWVGCTLFGKSFRGQELFRRHVLIHTRAKTCPCYWEGCGEWFKDEGARRLHVARHLREKKAREREAERRGRSEEGEQTVEDRAKTLRLARKRRAASSASLVRDNYNYLLPDRKFSERTMRALGRQLKRLADCPNKTVELSSQVAGELHDRMGSKTWLLQANIDSSLTCWSSNPDSKVSVPLRRCPTTVLSRLGLYRSMGKRKQSPLCPL